MQLKNVNKNSLKNGSEWTAVEWMVLCCLFIVTKISAKLTTTRGFKSSVVTIVCKLFSSYNRSRSLQLSFQYVSILNKKLYEKRFRYRFAIFLISVWKALLRPTQRKNLSKILSYRCIKQSNFHWVVEWVE